MNFGVCLVLLQKNQILSLEMLQKQQNLSLEMLQNKPDLSLEILQKLYLCSVIKFQVSCLKEE